jgi:hypothetical protein
MESKPVVKHRGHKHEPMLPFKWINIIMFIISLLVIAAGYVALGQKPYDSWVSLNIAPVLLVLGYVVLIPLSLLYNPKDKTKNN